MPDRACPAAERTPQFHPAGDTPFRSGHPGHGPSRDSLSARPRNDQVTPPPGHGPPSAGESLSRSRHVRSPPGTVLPVSACCAPRARSFQGSAASIDRHDRQVTPGAVFPGRGGWPVSRKRRTARTAADGRQEPGNPPCLPPRRSMRAEMASGQPRRSMRARRPRRSAQADDTNEHTTGHPPYTRAEKRAPRTTPGARSEPGRPPCERQCAEEAGASGANRADGPAEPTCDVDRSPSPRAN